MKISKGGDFTALLGNLLQCSSSFTVKHFLLRVSHNFPYCIVLFIVLLLCTSQEKLFCLIALIYVTEDYRWILYFVLFSFSSIRHSSLRLFIALSLVCQHLSYTVASKMGHSFPTTLQYSSLIGTGTKGITTFLDTLAVLYPCESGPICGWLSSLQVHNAGSEYNHETHTLSIYRVFRILLQLH